MGMGVVSLSLRSGQAPSKERWVRISLKNHSRYQMTARPVMGMGDCVPLDALGVGPIVALGAGTREGHAPMTKTDCHNQQRTLGSHIAQKPFAIPGDNTEEGWEEQEEQLTIK
jgi:hypothetical protein